MDCYPKLVPKKRRRGVTSYQKIDNDLRVKLLGLVYKKLTIGERRSVYAQGCC
jgi:hypothetical protein